MVSAGDYWPFVEAIRRARRAWWLGATSRRAVEREVISAAERTRTLLADGPRPRRELMQALGVDGSTWNGIGLWVDLVRVPPSGTWDRRSADLYGLAEDWVGPPAATEQQGGRAADPAIPRRVRARLDQGPRELVRALPRLARAGPGSDLAASVPRPRRRRAGRPAAGAAPRPGDARTGPLPPDVGRDVARACTPDADPAGALPAADLQHQDPALGTDLPRRRAGRRDLEGGSGRHPDHAVRTPVTWDRARTRRGGRASRRLPRRDACRLGRSLDEIGDVQDRAGREPLGVALEVAPAIGRRGSVTPTEVGGCYRGAAPSRRSSPTVRSSSPTIRLGKPRKASTNAA